MNRRQKVGISGSEPAHLTALVKHVRRLWRDKAKGHCVALCVLSYCCEFVLSVFVCVGLRFNDIRVHCKTFNARHSNSIN